MFNLQAGQLTDVALFSVEPPSVAQYTYLVPHRHVAIILQAILDLGLRFTGFIT